jgi:hypothetical protein
MANTIPRLSREDGRAFDLHSFDLSEYSTVFREPLVVHVQGKYLGGGKILAILRTDGIVDGSNGSDDDFEHFALGAPWRNLESVSFVAIHGFALDNLELTDTNCQVPALSATSQLVVAVAISVLALLRLRPQARIRQRKRPRCK